MSLLAMLIEVFDTKRGSDERNVAVAKVLLSTLGAALLLLLLLLELELVHVAVKKQAQRGRT